MSSKTVYRWSGIVLLLGGLLGVISSILDTVLYPGHHMSAQQILSTPFTIDSSLFLVWALLLAMGLPGLYLRQAGSAGKLGFTGFVLLSLGVLLGGVVFAAIQTTIFPYLAQVSPKTFGPGGHPPVAVFLLAIIGPTLLLSIGAILLGIATMRAHVFSRWAGILLLASGIVFFLTLPPLPSPLGDLIGLVGNVIFFAILAWFGYALIAWEKQPVAVAELSTSATQVGR